MITLIYSDLKGCDIIAKMLIDGIRDMPKQMDMIRHYHILNYLEIGIEPWDSGDIVGNYIAKQTPAYIHFWEGSRQFAEIRNPGSLLECDMVYAPLGIVMMKGSAHDWIIYDADKSAKQ